MGRDKQQTELDISQKKVIEDEVLSSSEKISMEDVPKAMEEGREKAATLLSSPVDYIVQLARQTMLLCELLYDWVAGNYPDCPWRSIAIITAAVAYFVSPIDLIPDPIPIIGYLDDAYVIALAIRLCRDDLVAYARFRDMDPASYGL